MDRRLKIPAHFSSEERAFLSFHIASAETQSRPYAGKLTANWLLNGYDEHKWILRTSTTRKVSDAWKGTVSVDWNINLSDGTSLTDSINVVMLSAIKLATFLVRELDISGITNTRSHITLIGDLITITRWLYLHANKYSPAEHGFLHLNENAIKRFMTDFIEGGTAWVLQQHHLLLNGLYKEALGHLPPRSIWEDVFHIPATDRDRICSWLRQRGFYVRTAQRKYPHHLSRQMLSDLVGIESSCWTQDKFTALVRQFEPELLGMSDKLLLPADGVRSEFCSHRTPFIEEVMESKLTFSGTIGMLQSIELLFKLRRHDPNVFPCSDDVEFAKLRKFVSRASCPNSATPWIPLCIALEYTKEALRWVAIFGPTLANFYLAAIVHFHRHDLLNVGSDETMKERKRDARNRWVREHLPPELSQLNISGWTTFLTHYQIYPFVEIRQRPGLLDVMEIFFGACVVLLSTVKPIRIEEIRNLHKDCIRFCEGDGYFLRQEIGKRGMLDLKNTVDRPIPAIAATAVTLLKKISDKLKSLADERDVYALDRLFYFDSIFAASFNPHLSSRISLTRSIDRFCDFVNVPPDEFGRRWYFRTHEGRKSFLITFFWCGKYASLGAASWMAGHKSWEQTLTYIKASLPGNELPEFEAGYAAEQLWNFERKLPIELKNIELLYQVVCKHFGVTQVNLIKSQDLKEWLTAAFEREIYKIEPIVIVDKRQRKTMEVAFRIQRKGKNEGLGV